MSLYEILGVPPDADQKAIRLAWAQKIAEIHPDTSDDPEAHDKACAVNGAYEVLSDPENGSTCGRASIPSP